MGCIQIGYSKGQQSTKDRESIVELLIRNGADVHAKDKDGIPPLHLASAKYSSAVGTKNIAEVLIEKGADVNATTSSGATPLHFAAQEGNRPVAELLVEKGANVNARDENGMAPLHWTNIYAWGYVVTELLIAKGADVNARAKDGATPLNVARRMGHQHIAELLMKHGAEE